MGIYVMILWYSEEWMERRKNEKEACEPNNSDLNHDWKQKNLDDSKANQSIN